MIEVSDIQKRLDETVRSERGWLISSLVSHLGPSKIDLAEDVAQDAILKALSTWPYKGVPDNPRAWLRRVAGNAAIDRLRRSSREFGLPEDWDLAAIDEDVVTPSLGDPELDLMVLCCDPAIQPQDQLFLALKTVSGFTAAETASLFFLKEDALSQRLARAKRTLKHQAGELARYPTRFALKQRFPQLLRVIYLMFTWGYLPRRGGDLVRNDLCVEAARLSEGLFQQPGQAMAAHHALHALLLFQMSRFAARAGSDGELITLEHQDRSLWDKEKIAQGFDHLQSAQSGSELSRYHLEAGIASCHAQAPSWKDTDWEQIARLYAIMAQQSPSLGVLVSWATSLIQLGNLDHAAATLARAEGIAGAANFPGFQLAQAKLATAQGDLKKAVAALEQAKSLSTSSPVKNFIEQEIAVISVTDQK